MKTNKNLKRTIILVLVIIVILGIWQIKVSMTGCGGDFNWMVKCPVGSYCKVGNNPLAGGRCSIF